MPAEPSRSHLWSVRAAICAAVLVVAVGAVYLVERLQLGRTEQNWAVLREEAEVKAQEEITNKFSSYENDLLVGVEQTASLQNLQEVLRHPPDSVSSIFFDITREHTLPNATLEIYDRDKELLAWAGRSGTPIDTSKLSANT